MQHTNGLPSCRQQAQGRSPRGNPQPVLAQMASPQVAAAASRHVTVALNTCTMEELPLGGTAWNACTMEELPSGKNNASPLAGGSSGQHRGSSPASAGLPKQGQDHVLLSPRQQRVNSPGPASLKKPGHDRALTCKPQQEREGHQGTGQGQGQGPKQAQGPRHGLCGVGLFARNAAAALCSARRENLEPRNPYRLIKSHTLMAH